MVSPNVLFAMKFDTAFGYDLTLKDDESGLERFLDWAVGLRNKRS